MKVKRIIEIDEDTFKRIDEAKSVPDMFGTDIVNGLNTIKFSKPYDDSGDSISREKVINDFKQALDFGSATAYIRKLNELEKTDLVKLVLNILDNASPVGHSLLPLSGEADKAYMRGYEVGKAEGIMKANTRPQGEWEVIHTAIGETKYKCNRCQHYIKIGDDKNFCPNCGAEMRGGAE